ncbi:PLC-like phosphodiesterase [Piedraia hortae CBS 480.64]|uniref:Phosphoinositide phospholipase C n=1 Tax=Piedraia hortae CBS 480.64 TaxID=1314780 RepID=A0A6A7BUN6_9PEZI|nr:PLC-like phosphodiesterase [Piedraia hortae CBS 480.64]
MLRHALFPIDTAVPHAMTTAYTRPSSPVDASSASVSAATSSAASIVSASGFSISASPIALSPVPATPSTPRIPDRSPSPNARATPPHTFPHDSHSQAFHDYSRSPGLIRRLSRGAHNTLRRRASTNHMRMRDQSAGPTLVRRRSDSNGASELGDMSDLELDPNGDDVAERQVAEKAGLGIRLFNRETSPTDDFPRPDLQAGTFLERLTAKRRRPVKLWLNADAARVCWYGKVTVKSFGIDDVVAVQKGAESRHSRGGIHLAPGDEERLLVIVYAVDDRSGRRSTKMLCLLMPTAALMKAWTAAVDTVTDERAASMKALSSRPEESEKGMAILWRQACRRNAGAEHMFTIDDARHFCRRLHINCSSSTVALHFQKADVGNRNALDETQYRAFVRSFTERGDIRRLCQSLGSDSAEPRLDRHEFVEFLRSQQGITDTETANVLFDRYARERLQDRRLAIDLAGMQAFLTSADNSPLPPVPLRAKLDRPLNEYFISSSHNTYLQGYQVRGTSTVEGYINALMGGCRCVEIDCWDGDDGRPRVTHGRTLTTKILFEDCVSVIARYAFHSSPYPLIISLEVHCNAEQQAVMVEMLYAAFGSRMVTEPLGPTSALPSPEELRERILIKVKAADDSDQSQLLADANSRRRTRSLSSPVVPPRSSAADSAVSTTGPSWVFSSPGTMSPSDSVMPSSTPRGSTTSGQTMTPTGSDDSDTAANPALRPPPPATSKIIPRLGRLGVYTQGISFPKAYGFSDPRAKAVNHIFSFSEDTFQQHARRAESGSSGGGRLLLRRHNVHYLMRVYPGKKRILSQNFNPLPMWQSGVQMVALNWQNNDVHQQINRAMFAAGSDGTGYSFKPVELRQLPTLSVLGVPDRRPKSPRHLVRFTVEIISALRLPRPRDFPQDAAMNPYVVVEIFSADCGSAGDDESALQGRTRTVRGNAFDPCFDESISMSLITQHPDLVFVRWTVWHQADTRRTTSGNISLATFTAKMSQLRKGYRHLPLRNAHGELFQEAKLFVKIQTDMGTENREDVAPSNGLHVPNASSVGLGGNSWSYPRSEPRSDLSWPRRLFSRGVAISRTSSVDRAIRDGTRVGL